MNSSFELIGLVGIVGVLYLLSKNKAAQAQMQSGGSIALAPIYRANVIPTAFKMNPTLGANLYPISSVPYYLNRNTPAYPALETDQYTDNNPVPPYLRNNAPPYSPPTGVDVNAAIWSVTP